VEGMPGQPTACARGHLAQTPARGTQSVRSNGLQKRPPLSGVLQHQQMSTQPAGMRELLLRLSPAHALSPRHRRRGKPLEDSGREVKIEQVAGVAESDRNRSGQSARDGVVYEPRPVPGWGEHGDQLHYIYQPDEALVAVLRGVVIAQIAQLVPRSQ